MGRVAGWVILLGVVVTAIAGATLAPESYLSLDLARRLAGPDLTHWLGRDALGRDVWSRLLAGTTTTVATSLAIVAVAISLGSLANLASPVSRHRRALAVTWGARICFIAPAFLLGIAGFGRMAMAVLCATLLLPGFLLVIAVVVHVGPGRAIDAVALGLLFSVAVAYRAGPIEPKLAGYGEALAGRALVLFGWGVLALSALDYLGLGLQAPGVSWGTMLADARGPHRGAVAAASGLIATAASAVMLGGGLEQRAVAARG